jgi:hypothetical protein
MDFDSYVKIKVFEFSSGGTKNYYEFTPGDMKQLIAQVIVESMMDSHIQQQALEALNKH